MLSTQGKTSGETFALRVIIGKKFHITYSCRHHVVLIFAVLFTGVAPVAIKQSGAEPTSRRLLKSVWGLYDHLARLLEHCLIQEPAAYINASRTGRRPAIVVWLIKRHERSRPASPAGAD